MQRRSSPSTLFACAVISSALGCARDGAATGPAAPERRSWLGAPAAVSDSLVWVDTERDEAVWVELAGDAQAQEPAAITTSLPPNPVAALERTQRAEELLVWTAGLRGVGASPALVVAQRSGEPRSYPIDAPYTALRRSADGRYALLFFEQGGSTLAFPSAHATIVDLERDGGAAARQIDLAVDGRAPTRVWVSPALRTGAGFVQLAVASYPRKVALLDLAHPLEGPVIVTLTGDESVVTPAAEVVFLPSLGRLALRAPELDDVFVLALQPEPASPRGYRVTLDQYPLGSPPRALAVATAGSSTRLLALGSDGRTLRAIDPAGGSTAELVLDVPVHTLQASASSVPYALAYAVGSAQVVFVAPDTLAPRAPLALPAPVSASLADPDHGIVYLQHDDGALSLCDLVGATVAPIGVRADALASLAVAPDGALWLAPLGSYLVARFDPETRRTREVLLDQAIDSLVFVPEAGRAVVVHDEQRLLLSVLDLAAPEPVPASTVRGLR